MGNVSALADTWNCPNYTGELFLIGANQTPFLNLIGGLQGGAIRTVRALQYPLAQPWALEAASQPAITEAASVAGASAFSYVRGQDVNTCQIFHRAVGISYLKQSSFGEVVADATTQRIDLTGNQPVQNEKDFQIAAHMRQIAIDAEYTFLQGTYAQATANDVAAKTRGILAALTTNTVAGGAAQLDKPIMNSLLRAMATNGSEFGNPVIFCNAYQKQKLSDIYGYAPTDRNVGGYNINQIETDFAILGVVWAPQMPTDQVLIADLAVCSPVFLPVPEKGVLFYEELAKDGASEKGQIYGQMGLDYGPEEYHGKITGLATS